MRRRVLVVTAVVVGAAVVLVLAAHQMLDRTATRARSGPMATAPSSTTAPPETDQEVAAAWGRAAWLVDAKACDRNKFGTAWPIDEHHLVTVAHVVIGDPFPTVTDRDGRVLSGRVVGLSRSPDLAVIEVGEVVGPVLRWADAASLDVGERVVGLGYGVEAEAREVAFEATGGTLVAFEESRTVPGWGAVLTDATSGPGSSGGPLVTFDGKVAGLVTEEQEIDGRKLARAFTSIALGHLVDSMVKAPEPPKNTCLWRGGWLRDETPIVVEDPEHFDDEPSPDSSQDLSPPCPEGKLTVNLAAPTTIPWASEGGSTTWFVSVTGSIRNDSATRGSLESVRLWFPGADQAVRAEARSTRMGPGEAVAFVAWTYVTSREAPSVDRVRGAMGFSGPAYLDCGPLVG
jgi:hypothetical protein